MAGSLTSCLESTSSKARKTQILECRVCDNVFGLQGEKIPRLLFCGHTLCHSCLSKLPRANHSEALVPSSSRETALASHEVIQCPFDRQPTTLGPNGVWDLKKNFALLEAIEDGIVNQENVFSDVFLERERGLSVCCDENEEHIAVVYCTTCATHLCVEVIILILKWELRSLLSCARY